MEQMTLFTPPYKYLIDSSSILAQKPSDAFPRLVHKSMWAMIEKSIRDQIIVTCSEIEEEVKNDKTIGSWLGSQQCTILPIDEEIQLNVRKIVTECPKMISFAGGQGSSSGDAFLIATAMKYNLTIYRYRTRNPISTYYYYRWKDWSAWSTTAVFQSNTKEVETATFYRYRDRVTQPTYYFQRWTEWSEYFESPVGESDTVEVRTKTQYRYHSK